MTLKSKILLFVGVAAIHWIVQFVAWAEADEVNAGAVARTAFAIVSAPLMPLLASHAADHFSIANFLNSLIWAAAMTFACARIVRCRARTALSG